MRCAMTRADNRRALKILAFKFGRECFVGSLLLQSEPYLGSRKKVFRNILHVFFCYVFGKEKSCGSREGIYSTLKAEMG